MDFEEIFENYYDRIYRYVYSILLNRENAEEVVSETFLAAYRAYHRYDPKVASPSTWLFRIAHNKTVDFVKSPAYSRVVPLSDEELHGGISDHTNDIEKRDMVERLYEKLSIEEREFLDMRYVMDLKDREVAEILDIPEKTINKRYQRLLKKCREIL